MTMEPRIYEGKIMCQATASVCRCGLAMHSDDVAHECENTTTCGGSWYGDGIQDDAFQVVRYPIVGSVLP